MKSLASSRCAIASRTQRLRQVTWAKYAWIYLPNYIGPGVGCLAQCPNGKNCMSMHGELKVGFWLGDFRYPPRPEFSERWAQLWATHRRADAGGLYQDVSLQQQQNNLNHFFDIWISWCFIMKWNFICTRIITYESYLLQWVIMRWLITREMSSWNNFPHNKSIRINIGV